MKLIVADDEKWVRAAIINSIPFEELGMSLACEAADGLEALELCLQHKPDILLTDIRMPGLTGIELAEELKGPCPDTRVVIISGYSDFEYAKTAIKYGVSDYLLKPVDEAELKQVLLKVKEDVLKEKEHREEESTLRDRYRQALPIVCESFLGQLVLPNSLLTDHIHKTLVKYGIDFHQPGYTLAVFSPDSPSARVGTSGSKAFKELAGRIMKRYLGAVTFSRSPDSDELVSIINHPHPQQPDSLSRAIDLCTRLFEKHFHGALSVGVSTSAPRITELPELYRHASEALDMRFWENDTRVFYFREVRMCGFPGIGIPEEVLDTIVLGIRLSDCLAACEFIDGTCRDLRACGRIKPTQVREFFWAFLQSVVSRLGTQMSFIEYVVMLTGSHPYERVKSIHSLEHLSVYVKQLVQHACDHYRQKNCGNDTENVIEAAKRIIEKNYAMDISLEQISKCVHLNPTYFSELFKKETGLSFIDYKILQRMENAKRLLLGTDLNVQEISLRVGYSDPKYFSRLFKKITGTTTQEFKKSGRDT